MRNKHELFATAEEKEAPHSVYAILYTTIGKFKIRAKNLRELAEAQRRKMAEHQLMARDLRKPVHVVSETDWQVIGAMSWNGRIWKVEE